MREGQGFVGRYVAYPDNTANRRAEGGRRLKGVVRESRSDAPLVTIITVCWNSARTLEQTIRSVIGQTYDNIEYIIVDGASEDGTLEIIRRFEDLIDYYVSEPDEGIYAAMNKGLELAHGDFIMLLNSDDWYVDDAVEALVAAVEYSDCDLVSGLERHVNADGKLMKISPVMQFDHSIYLRASIHHETMLIPSHVYNKVGPYDSNFQIVGDLDLMIRIFEYGFSHYKLHKQITFFSRTGVSSTDRSGMDSDRRKLIRKVFPFLQGFEVDFLADRRSWSGRDLINLTLKYADREYLIKAVHDYMIDHIGRAKQGRGLHARWQPYAEELLDSIARYRRTWSPKVSIVLAVYNAEDTLRECIESVLSQDLHDIELICVNDQTPDDSQQIIDEFCRKDNRVRALVNEMNLGLGATRNRGVAAAHGQFVFHLDPDDTLPLDALEMLYQLALQYGSDMTRGAYTHEQHLMGEAKRRKKRKGLNDGAKHIVNTTLGDSPNLLDHTEGHWSFLYRADFAKRVRYPENLRMGQDSLFLVNAMIQAESISVTDAVVYNYRTNTKSAMNTFNFQKFMDALEWRRRAWHALNAAGHKARGDHLLFNYWNEELFDATNSTLSSNEKHAFLDKLATVLREGHYTSQTQVKNRKIRAIFERVTRDRRSDDHPARSNGIVTEPASDTRTSRLTVATCTVHDFGGAGQGSQRRVEALRDAGVNAEIHCIFKKTNKSHVHRVPLTSLYAPHADNSEELNAAWKRVAILTSAEAPKLRARDLFSKTGSIVDFDRMQSVFTSADVVHFHWVAGLMDYEKAPVHLGDKPVVWTLADMNAFTGGCHYSEGCEGYKAECKACPLLGGSDLAHENWKRKKRAYDNMSNIHIICPSQWLADRVKESTLLGARPIHVLSNALPIARFQPTNKAVARQRLGLPLDKKLIVFGATDQKNVRKGGDILAQSLALLRSQGRAENIEGLTFGWNHLEIGIPTHNMGLVEDERQMSLIYAAADVLAFPSREDNAPLTVPESLLSGTPVVAFPVGNVPDLVNHLETGYLARYEDEADFTVGLAWALENPRSPLTLSRSIHGRLHARDFHNPECSARCHVQLYNLILE